MDGNTAILIISAIALLVIAFMVTISKAKKKQEVQVKIFDYIDSISDSKCEQKQVVLII